VRDDRRPLTDAGHGAAELAAALKLPAGAEPFVAADMFRRRTGIDDVAQRPGRRGQLMTLLM
jgi:hypothetical protein